MTERVTVGRFFAYQMGKGSVLQFRPGEYNVEAAMKLAMQQDGCLQEQLDAASAAEKEAQVEALESALEPEPVEEAGEVEADEEDEYADPFESEDD